MVRASLLPRPRTMATSCWLNRPNPSMKLLLPTFALFLSKPPSLWSNSRRISPLMLLMMPGTSTKPPLVTRVLPLFPSTSTAKPSSLPIGSRSVPLAYLCILSSSTLIPTVIVPGVIAARCSFPNQTVNPVLTLNLLLVEAVPKIVISNWVGRCASFSIATVPFFMPFTRNVPVVNASTVKPKNWASNDPEFTIGIPLPTSIPSSILLLTYEHYSVPNPSIWDFYK
jgi:hypothetical protein